MAYIATVDTLPSIRRSAYNPGNSGDGGNPKPNSPGIRDIRPPVLPINNRCVSRQDAYPAQANHLTVGTKGKASFNRSAKICQAQKHKGYKRLTFASNTVPSKRIPLETMPAGQLDRNPRPMTGAGSKSIGFRKLRVIRHIVNNTQGS